MPLLSASELQEIRDESFYRGVLAGVLVTCFSLAVVVGIVAWVVLP